MEDTQTNSFTIVGAVLAAVGASLCCVLPVVVAIAGRRPNTASLKLDRAGVATDAGGAIDVDSYLRTTAEHIYAGGDRTNAPVRSPRGPWKPHDHRPRRSALPLFTMVEGIKLAAQTFTEDVKQLSCCAG